MTDETPPDLPKPQLAGVSAAPPPPPGAQFQMPGANPHENVEIDEQAFRVATLKCLHTMTNHLCALALSAKQPDRNRQGRLVPMSPEDQMYHTAMQHDLNLYMDKLLGWDKYAEGMKPTLAVDNADSKLDLGFLDPNKDPDGAA